MTFSCQTHYCQTYYCQIGLHDGAAPTAVPYLKKHLCTTSSGRVSADLPAKRCCPAFQWRAAGHHFTLPERPRPDVAPAPDHSQNSGKTFPKSVWQPAHRLALPSLLPGSRPRVPSRKRPAQPDQPATPRRQKIGKSGRIPPHNRAVAVPFHQTETDQPNHH